MLSDEELLEFKLDCYKNLIKNREKDEFKEAISENRKRLWDGYIYGITVTPLIVSDYAVDLSRYINNKVDKSKYAKFIIGDSLSA